ncbi:LOW QUALITY PROTEIN: coiled-coil domain-containing protein 112 [Chanos chanos]|uniref:LOW QUALITY PROTEIN: coiled-coil domain-containing protein 112 n=1 Tax=Chanos chanos TaxID=29144 RepID=A0A6J2UKV7_CHACN|nr:LOW QUALITY PROTEIN: coiled-coil domain-containing protein 112 [Chanos chanos]
MTHGESAFTDNFSTVPSTSQTSNDRMALAKKTEFLRKAEHLRKLFEKLEKERSLNIRDRRNNFRDCFSVVEEYDNKLQSELKTEILRIQQQLQKIRNSVYRFQGHLTDVKPSPELIEKLKDIMTEVENSINTFKEDQHQKFEGLLKEERSCWQEIGAFEKKIETWSLSANPDPKLPSAPSAKRSVGGNSGEELPPEVSALEAFLQQTGGILGGWDRYDHQSFMKIWNKHGGKASYREEAQLFLPGRTEEEIRQHEEWYLKLCCLQERKREAIQNWRLAKQREKSTRLRQRDEAEEARRREQVEVAEVQRRRLEERQREAKEHLQAWKNQQKLQQEQEELQRLREEVLQRKKDKEERRRQLEVKLAVEAQVQQRREQEQRLLLEKESQERAEMEERRRLATVHIRHFQERDLHKLGTKLLEKQSKEGEKLERQKRLAKLKERVEVHIKRDPCRLWKPTKGWEERTKEIGPTGGGPVYQMFHRAVPTWRQGL